MQNLLNRFSLLTLFLVWTIVGLSIALVINQNRLAKSMEKVDLLYNNSSLIKEPSVTGELNVKQHFRLPPNSFRFSVAPPPGESYRICVGHGRADQSTIKALVSAPLVTGNSNTAVVTVNLISDDQHWRCQIVPNGNSFALVRNLDWIEPEIRMRTFAGGSHAPEFGTVQSFPSGRTFLTLVNQHDWKTQPRFVPQGQPVMDRSGPTTAVKTGPGMVFAIWLEPITEEETASTKLRPSN